MKLSKTLITTLCLCSLLSHSVKSQGEIVDIDRQTVFLEFLSSGKGLLELKRNGEFTMHRFTSENLRGRISKLNCAGLAGNQLVVGGRGFVEVWEIEDSVKRISRVDLKGDLQELPYPAYPVEISDISWVPGGSLVVGTTLNKELFLLDTSSQEILWKKEDAHTGTIADISICPANTQIATAGSDGFIKTWDLQNGDLKKTVKSTDEMNCGVSSIAFVGDDRLISTGRPGEIFGDYTVRVWDLNTLAETKKVDLDSIPCCVKISEAQNSIWTLVPGQGLVGWHQTANIVDLEKKNFISLEEVNDSDFLALSPNGAWVAVTQNGNVLLHSTDKTQAEAEEQSELKTNKESPVEVFHSFQQAFESGEWATAVENFSPGMTKTYVFEVFFAAGESSKAREDAHFAIAQKYKIDTEKIAGDIEEQEGDKADAMIDAIMVAATDVNGFLSESMPLFLSKRRRYKKQLRDLKIDGGRARAVATRVSYSWHNQANGKAKREEHYDDENIFFRKHEDQWKLCIEGEWKDPEYKLNIK